MEKSDEALISTPGTDTSALNQSEKLKTPEKKKEELSLHHFFMDSLWRYNIFVFSYAWMFIR